MPSVEPRLGDASAAIETPDGLRERRLDAAMQSLGQSDDVIYAAIERVLPGGGDLLDFGAGAGNFTSRLHASGRFRSVTGVDLYPKAESLPSAVGWVQADLNDPVPVRPASFDVIVAAEVIEHLENPRAMCRELFRLLRPGGTLVLSTPNNESWRSLIALVVRGHFVAFGAPCYPAHITALVRQDLQRILTEAGFANCSFTFTDSGGIPGRPAVTWQKLLGDRVRGLRFSDNLVVTATKPAS
jgi:2-polyprenyl-3-methyl-5-hydroxy-6-metoxy-1,4-benzoquinol methylase